MKRGVAVVAVLFSAAVEASPLVVPAGVPAALAAAPITTVDIVGPVGSGAFGNRLLVLDSGNFVIVDPLFDSVTQPDVGAVYLYDGVTNQLISTLRGSSANDQLGSFGLAAVGSSNFVVRSPLWDNGAIVDAGAVTWVNGTSGLNGVVSPSNSLVGSSFDDRVGGGSVSVLITNKNYVVGSPSWNAGAVADVGAVTWGNGNAGVFGPVSVANSLLGATAGDGVGNVSVLTNGNYVLRATAWDNGGIVDAGAAAWGNGSTGSVGVVSTANSLYGTHTDDHVGFSVSALENGNYVVRSPDWDNGAIANAGAATWSNGSAGITGAVSTANSLYGSTAGDRVSLTSVDVLTDGDFVVSSANWDNTAPATVDAGAATWGNGATGIIGAVSASNSLVGAQAGDQVAAGGTVALTNGHYVVRSPFWRNGGAASAGAATWGSGAGGAVGPLTTANSIYGTTTSDLIGFSGIHALENGNYVILSPAWNNGGATVAGAATWANGAGPSAFAVGAANSVVGSTTDDRIGFGFLRELVNGNVVINSPDWDRGATADAGAVTWINGATGGAGPVSAANSLVGTSAGDEVGSGLVAVLSNGNYVVASPSWDNGVTVDVGAVTWGDGATGTVGPVSVGNSLIGTKAMDLVGQRVVPLTDGNYVTGSPAWDNGAVVDAGALTWLGGSGPTAASVTSANSLVGTTANDFVSNSLLFALPNGGFVTLSRNWDNGGLADAGAVSFGRGGPVVGAVTAANSVRGTAPMVGTTMSALSKVTAAGSVVVSRSVENIVTLLVLPPLPNYVPLAPARLADTRPGEATVDGVQAGGGLREGGSTLEVTVAGRGGVAADAVAVALNVTTVDAVADGFATMFPCDELRPLASNINIRPQATVPNAVLAKIGAGGKVCVFVSQPTHVVVDVNGFFPVTSTYHSSNPARLLDTRAGEATVDGQQAGIGARDGDTVTEVQVTGRAGVPANATTVALNVTVTEAFAAGFATIFPCGEPRPTASNLNYAPGQTIANLVVAKIGVGGKVCIYTQAISHLIADANGFFPAVTTYRSLNPARLLDTRSGFTTVDGAFNETGFVAAGSVTTLKVTGRGGVPNDAETVVVNVTVTEPEIAGYATAYPCGIDPPLASNLNYIPGQNVPNAALVKVGAGGNICIYNSQATHLVIDVNGYFPPTP